MKTTFYLKISKEEVMDAFIHFLAEDVLAYTGKKINKKDLKPGFVYQKNISDNPKKKKISTVKITEYVYPSHYSVEYFRDGYRKKAVYDFSDDKKGCCFCMKQQIEKQVKGENGNRIWTIIDSFEKEKRPSFMQRIQMNAMVRYSKKLQKRNCLEGGND